MNRLERFTFRLSQEELMSLHALADELRRSKSDVVRFLLKEKISSVSADKKLAPAETQTIRNREIFHEQQPADN